MDGLPIVSHSLADRIAVLAELVSEGLFERGDGYVVLDHRAEQEKRLASLDAFGPHPVYGELRAIPLELESWPAHWLEASGIDLADRIPRGATHTIAELVAAANRGPVTGRIHGTVIVLVGQRERRARRRRRRHSPARRLVPGRHEHLGPRPQEPIRARGGARASGWSAPRPGHGTRGDHTTRACGRHAGRAGGCGPFCGGGPGTPRRGGGDRHPPARLSLDRVACRPDEARSAVCALWRRCNLLVGQRRRAARDPVVRADDDWKRGPHRPRRVLQLPADRARGVLRRRGRRPARLPIDQRRCGPRQLCRRRGDPTPACDGRESSSGS